MFSKETLEVMLNEWIEQKKKEPSVSGFCGRFVGFLGAAIAIPSIVLDNIDFRKRKAERGDETFSKMLLRLIHKSGEKPSTIYKRANIDRRHFSKIINHDDYQPSKQTALSFVIALKLDYEKTQKLLATAGYTIGNSTLDDIIISFFIEHKIFDVDLINEFLYKYEQPLLGAGDPRDDEEK